MFGKEINCQKGNTSIISKGMSIKGNVISDGILEIEGDVDGDITGNIITLRETSSVKGNIVAKILNVKGKFVGIIKSEKINVSEHANINGTLEYMSLCVEDGAIIEADLKRTTEIKGFKASNISNPKIEIEDKNNKYEKNN